MLNTIANPIPNSSDFFGEKIGIFGDHLVVGAPLADVGAFNSGAVYVFDASNGGLEQIFLNPNPRVDERSSNLFGTAFSIIDDYIVIGAPGTPALPQQIPFQQRSGSGASYLFNLETRDLLQSIGNPTPEGNGLFGWSIASFDNRILIGEPGDSNVGDHNGAVYRYLLIPVPSTLSLLGISFAALLFTRRAREL